MRLEELARVLGASLEGEGGGEIRGVASIELAEPDEVTFLANPKYRRQLATSRAAAVILGPGEDAQGRAALRVPDPYLAFARALALFDRRPTVEPDIHPTAVIADSARIGAHAYVGPYAVIGARTIIGSNARIHPHVTIYPDVRIGDRFTAHAGVVVRETVQIGDNVTLQPGVVLGGDGFGFVPRADRPAEPIPQIGTVRLEDSVDVGANSTVDRATVGETLLARGVKLDNLVMIAHGCEVGEGAMLAAQFGMAGSSKVGKGVAAGGQVGVSGHLRIGDGVRIAAQTGVAGDVAAGQVIAGSPAVEMGVWRRSSVLLRRLPELFRRLRALEDRFAQLRERR